MIKHIFLLLASFLALSLFSGCAVGVSQPMVQPMREPAIAEAPAVGQTEVVVTLVPQATRTPAAGAATATVLPTATAISTTAAKSTQTGQEPADPFAQAMANIRTLTGLPDLQLAPAGKHNSPNASLYPAIAFNDDMGNSYYVYQETQRVIEFTQERMPALYTPGQAKTAEELRGIALGYATKYSINFEKYQKFLTYTEGGKSGENYFYRWEYKNTDVGGMPALLQIGLKSDGQIFGYLNSLDLIELPSK